MKLSDQEYFQNSKHLPYFLQDFHDQKDIFKTIQAWATDQGKFNELPNSWVDNQVFTIDYFLWAMALHGYKLQKIKSKNIRFLDVEKFNELK